MAATEPAPGSAVAEAVAAVTAWQKRLRLRRRADGEMDDVWPRGLSPGETLELKLALERGADRHTLLRVARRVLSSDAVRCCCCCCCRFRCRRVCCRCARSCPDCLRFRRARGVGCPALLLRVRCAVPRE